MSTKKPVVTIAELRTLTKHREGDTIVVEGTGDIYVFDNGASDADDGNLFVRPTNYDSDGVWIKRSETGDDAVQFVDVLIATADVKTLNATPVEVVATPGATKAILFEGAILHLDYATTDYDGIAAGEDLEIGLAAGAALGQCEATGFMDASADAMRFIQPYRAASGISDITPVANTGLTIRMLVGEIATGDSPLRVRVYYRVIPIALA